MTRTPENDRVRRLLPDEPLPRYAFIPGRAPHPISDPAGHSFGRSSGSVTLFDPSQWRSCRPYLRGIDLFNHGFYWEAHEAWEPLWHAAHRRGPVADFIKALIQLAVAGVKHLENKPAGKRTHARRALELIQAAGLPGLLGLRSNDLVELAERMARAAWPDTPPLLTPE